MTGGGEGGRGLDRLGSLIDAASRGEYPPADGGVSVFAPQQLRRTEWVAAFTAHAVVVTALPPDAVMARGVDGFGSAMAPEFLLWLAGPGGVVGTQDVILVARGSEAGSSLSPRADLDDHPRVVHARSLREDVAVYADERGLVTVGRGIGGATELSVEVCGEHSRGTGTRLVRDAVGLAPAGELLVASVAPGNARSLRAFLAAGFVPVGAAVAVVPGPARTA